MRRTYVELAATGRIHAVATSTAVPTLRTDRLVLPPVPAPVLRALGRGNVAAASELAGLTVPADFLEQRSFWALRAHQAGLSRRWRLWVPRFIRLGADGPVAGHCGFHGPPDDRGMVEIGYTVLSPYRRHGYATEAAQALVDWAGTHPLVRMVRASVRPDNAASLAVIAQLGFERVGEQQDEEDGLEYVFERPAG
jgi:ribosomal-protein-alanine N-acetyltransferase